MNPFDNILLIIEKPNVEKGYRDLKKYYESIGKTNEASAIQYLIDTRFKNANNISIDKK